MTKNPKNPNKTEPSGSDMVFMGIRVPRDIHQRLYRAKARLELGTGKFYGMGRLLHRVLEIGLEQIEKDLGSSSLPLEA